MKSKFRSLWLAVPILSFGLVAGGAVAANAQGTVVSAGLTTIAPGATGNLDSAIFNGSVVSNTANVGIVFQAPEGSTFASANVPKETNTGGAGWVSQGSLSGCVLSNGNKTLTCPSQPTTVPANSYLRYLPQITVNANNGYISRGSVTYTSDNNSQIASGSNNPGFRTPSPVPAPIIPIAQGATGTLDTAIVNGNDYAKTAGIALVWQAPANSVFTSTNIRVESNNSGAGWVSQGSLTGCVLSNGGKTLTCPSQNVTIPGSSAGTTSYVRFLTDISVSPTAPENSTFTNSATWTSNNNDQITSGVNYPGYRTPLVTPIADPMVVAGVGVLALGSVAVAFAVRNRRAARN